MLDRSVAELAIEEQGRIGRDLHDSVSQELSGVALIGDGVARRLEIAGTPEAERVRQRAREAVAGEVEPGERWVAQHRLREDGRCVVGEAVAALSAGNLCISSMNKLIP